MCLYTIQGRGRRTKMAKERRRERKCPLLLHPSLNYTSIISADWTGK
jgi:hypothetical protein